MLRNKEGFTLGQLASVGVTFVVIAIVLGMGAKILGKMNTDSTGTTMNATIKNATAALAELSSWLPTIAVIVAAAVIIGIVVTYFYVKGQ